MSNGRKGVAGVGPTEVVPSEAGDWRLTTDLGCDDYHQFIVVE